MEMGEVVVDTILARVTKHGARTAEPGAEPHSVPADCAEAGEAAALASMLAAVHSSVRTPPGPKPLNGVFHCSYVRSQISSEGLWLGIRNSMGVGSGVSVPAVGAGLSVRGSTRPQ